MKKMENLAKKSVIGILKRIRERPGVFLGGASVERLHMFMLGYEICLYEEKYQSDEGFSMMSGFREFMRKKYRVQMSKTWADIISFYSGDDKEAFDLFYKLFDEYLEGTGYSWDDG